MDILYLPDVMKALKVSRPTAKRIMESGEIKCFVIGKRVATKREFLNDYINNQIMEAENERGNVRGSM